MATTSSISPPSLPSTHAVPSRPRPTHACIRCADRKVKCDRQSPCSTCVKHKVDCVFNPSHSAHPRKRQRRVKDQILADRLKYYEALLKEKGIDPTQLPATPESSSEQTVSTSPGQQDQETESLSFSNFSPPERVYKTQVLHGHGRFKFVDNSLWTRVVEELHDPEEALENSSNGESESEEEQDTDFGYILSSYSTSKSPRHPPPEQIILLWEIFLKNVDPVTKIVHIATLRPAILKASSNIEGIPRTFETLMFAIYGVAVMSLNDEDCKTQLGEPRKILLSRYLSFTKLALSRAKFMGTTSLVVLQAFILHLLAIRDISEPRSLYTLTGIAIRIADGMGLERDGTVLGLSPFETEIRRRIWWFLKSHDFRTAELSGLAKFRDFETSGNSTKWPTNINDSDLFPGMTSVKAETHALTDIVYLAMRYDLSNFAAKRIAKLREQGMTPSQFHLHIPAGSQVEMNQALLDAEQLLETKYLRYCDPSQPLHLLTMVTIRLAMNGIRFLTHHPRRWGSVENTPIAERQWVFEISINLLEQHNMVQTNSLLKRFSWQAPYFQQWHAFIHVLDVLRTNPLVPEAAKAWRLIEDTYEHTPDMIYNTKKVIHVAVGNLCLKAYSDRETALQNSTITSQSQPPTPTTTTTPNFILQLRQQRALAKAKRASKLAKTNLANLSTALESTNLQPSTALPSNDHNVGTLYQGPEREQEGQNDEGGEGGGDSFWHINGFNDEGLLHDAMNMNMNIDMDMDMDFLLPPDQGMQDVGLSWDQWDSWLADGGVGALGRSRI